MMLTDLADACRTAGLRVVETMDWKARGHGPMVAVETIVCHHTAGPSSGNMPSLNIITHGRAGLAGPLCNLGLARDGTVYVVAAGLAYHAGVVRSSSYGNGHSIGIEAEATGVGDCWSTVQMDAYARLCAALADHYGLNINRVLGHKEVCSPAGRKIDPNFDMPTFRRSVESAAAAKLIQETDMTPDQIAGAPISMLVGAKDTPTKVTLQDVLRDLEGTQDKHGAQLARIEALLKVIAEKG